MAGRRPAMNGPLALTPTATPRLSRVTRIREYGGQKSDGRQVGVELMRGAKLVRSASAPEQGYANSARPNDRPRNRPT
jgi:hypothetical protein